MKPELARLIVPLDTSAVAETVLPWAALVARDHAMDVHLISIWDPDEPFPGMDPGQPDEAALATLREYLDGVAEKEKTHGVRVTTEACCGDVVEEIARMAGEHTGNMVMLCTHGQGGYREEYIGRVTDRILRRVHAPVLVIPARP